MKRKNRRLEKCLILSLAALPACREEGDSPIAYEIIEKKAAKGLGEDAGTPPLDARDSAALDHPDGSDADARRDSDVPYDGRGEEEPDDRVLPQEDARVDQASGSQGYVTGFQVRTCMKQPPQVALPKGKTDPACEQRVDLVPVMEPDAGNPEVASRIEWEAENQSWISFGFRPDDQVRDHVWILGSRDAFDADGSNEPETLIRGCVENACPPESDKQCQPRVCAEISAYGIINLEGIWCFRGATFEEECAELELHQDGRRVLFRAGKGRGVVLGTKFHWKREPYLYIGTIAPDRGSVSGIAYDQMSLEELGSWEARR